MIVEIIIPNDTPALALMKVAEFLGCQITKRDGEPLRLVHKSLLVISSADALVNSLLKKLPRAVIGPMPLCVINQEPINEGAHTP